MQSFFFWNKTGGGAMAETLAPGKSFAIEEIRLHLSGAGAAENFTVTLDHVGGAAYDAVLETETTSSLTNVIIKPTRPILVPGTSEVDFALANSNTVTWGLEVIYFLV